MPHPSLHVGPMLRRMYWLAGASLLALIATAVLTSAAADRRDDHAVVSAVERTRLSREVQALALGREEWLRAFARTDDAQATEDNARDRRTLLAKLDSLAAIVDAPRESDAVFRALWLGSVVVELLLIVAAFFLAHRVVLRQAVAVVESQHEVLDRLAAAAEYRDDATGRHTERVGELAARIAQTMGFEPKRVATIRRAAALHDVGKIGIPDSILLKPGKLSPRERDVVRQHTVIGARILDGGHSAIVAMAARIARSHHERWDGKGYPDQLVAEAIPMEARITSVADVFDALRSKRPYRDEWALSLCLDEIRRQAGTQFDPVVVNAFLRGRCYEGYAVEGGASQDAEVAPTPIQESVMTTGARITTTSAIDSAPLGGPIGAEDPYTRQTHGAEHRLDERVERVAHGESTALLDVIA